jgi:hypothetical protein
LYPFFFNGHDSLVWSFNGVAEFLPIIFIFLHCFLHVFICFFLLYILCLQVLKFCLTCSCLLELYFFIWLKGFHLFFFFEAFLSLLNASFTSCIVFRISFLFFVPSFHSDVYLYPLLVHGVVSVPSWAIYPFSLRFSLTCFCMSSLTSLITLLQFFWAQKLRYHSLHSPWDPLLAFWGVIVSCLFYFPCFYFEICSSVVN